MEKNKYYEIGKYLQYKAKSYYEAHLQYLLAIALQPDCIDALNNCAQNLRLNLKDYNQAIKYYSKVIDINPSYEFAYSRRGICKGAIGNWEGQVDDYSEEIKISKPEAGLYVSRALINLKLNKVDAVIRDCEYALSLDSDSYAGILLSKLEITDR